MAQLSAEGRFRVAEPSRVVPKLLDHLARREPLRAETCASVPAGHYTSRKHLQVELDTVLRRWPQLVGLSCELPEPGSRIVRDDMRVPVVVTRDALGAVHALVNVCRHRGARVAEADGTSRRLTCPYHAWSYDLDGALAAVPDAPSFPGVAPGACRLPTLPVIEWGGTVWVVPEPDGPAPATMPPEALGPMSDDLLAYGLDEFQHWRRHRFDLQLNWKLVVDTFLEPYHFASLHGRSVGPIFVSNLCAADRFGSHIREVLPRRSIADLAGLPEADWEVVSHSAIVNVLFPNVVAVMQVDHLETWRVYPQGNEPGRSICELDFYIPGGRVTESAQRHWESNWELTIRTVLQEDFAMMAGVQRNLECGQLDHLTFGRNEPALAMYHQALAENCNMPDGQETSSHHSL